MRIQLMKNEEGYVVGYKMIPETADDQPIIEHIRFMYFAGIDGSVLKYDGRKSHDDNDETTELRWKMKCEKDKDIKKRREEREARRINRLNKKKS